MNKENILFGIAGLLLGLVVGFMVANSINQRGATPTVSTGPQSSALPPGHPDISANKALDAQGVASMPEVQAAISKAKEEPSDFNAQMKAAELFYQIQRFDEALNYLKRANQLQPDNYEVIVNLGNANFDAGKFEEAEKWYSVALVKKTEDVNVRTDLGLTFLFREPPDIDRAIQEFQRSLEHDPNHLQALQNLIVAYTKKGDAAQAKAALDRFESVSPDNSRIPKLREEVQKMNGSAK